MGLRPVSIVKLLIYSIDGLKSGRRQRAEAHNCNAHSMTLGSVTERYVFPPCVLSHS